MKRLMICLAASTALAACTTVPASDPVLVPVAAVPEPMPEPEPAPVAQAAAAELGTYGFDTAGMDTSVLPGNNFYEFANGTWAKNTQIPADKSNYGMFTRLDDISRERTRVIIEEQAKDPASKIGIAYNSFLDAAAIEAKGLAPFQPWLSDIKAIGSKAEYAAVAARADRMGIGSPIGLYIGQDDKSPDRYIATVFQGGIGLPDRDYYLAADPKMAEIRGKYLTHLTNVLTLAGEPNAAARAKAIVDFETKIARAHWNRVDSRDATKTYNLKTRDQFVAMTRGYDLNAFLQGIGLGSAREVIVAQPSAVTAIAGLIGSAPLAVLKDQLLVRSLDNYSAYLPAAFDKEQFAFYGTTLSGTPEQEARWKRAVSFTVGALADDVSKLYVDRHFPPETKAAADALVKNVVQAMGRRIDTLAWMAPETKVRARAKLANFTTKIGYPDRWQEYST
ncbi:MAG: M13 family metallopeptidase, partial [Pseudomonadota bacterium]|nr:M13 family metallopeptidase [Pseudomonadota bacterium]